MGTVLCLADGTGGTEPTGGPGLDPGTTVIGQQTGPIAAGRA